MVNHLELCGKQNKNYIDWSKSYDGVYKNYV
jgi:hypothetical protein